MVIKRRIGISSVLIITLLYCPTLFAGNLDSIEFNHEVKNSMANAVQAVCGKFVGNGISGEIELEDNESELFFRCRQMVHSANELAGIGPTGDSLSLTEDELGEAMLDLADEEIGVQGEWSTKTSNQQLANIQTRFSDLHSGSGGISLSGLQIQGQDTVDLGEAFPTTVSSQAGGNAGDPFVKWGAFLTGIITTGERDDTERQPGYDLDSTGITAGVDYRYNANFIAGMAAGYTSAEADLNNNGGSQDVDGYNLTLYGTYYRDMYYIDSSLSYGQYDYDSERTVIYDSINATPQASTEGEQWNLYLAGGYSFYQNAWEYTPYAQLRYLDVDIDAYDEHGGASPEINMSVADQSISSFQTVLGGKVSYTSSMGWGVLIPYGRADWHHEFKDESRSLKYQYVYDPFNTTYSLNSEDPDKNFYTLGLGTSAVFKTGQAYFDFETPIDLDNVENYFFSIGGRMEF